MDVKNVPELGTFAYHGVDLSSLNGSAQVATDCPFCGKEKHFFISTKKENVGQFQCKRCDLHGNRFTFLQLIYDRVLDLTKDDHYRALGKARETEFWQAFRDDSWAYDADRKRWLVPVHNINGSIVNLKVYRHDAKPKMQNTTGCNQHFYGLEELKHDGPIFVTEGEPDRVLLKFIFPQVDDRIIYSIIGCPGVDGFATCAKRLKKNEFANRDFVLLFDAGQRELKKMEEAAALLMKEYHARSVLIINWPESIPDGYDVSDLINQKGKDDAWAKIISWLRPFGKSAIANRELKDVSLSHVVKAFKESGVHVNKDFADAIAIVAATIISIRYGGIPLWLYLVGPPGKGKSLILESTIQSPLCHYQTDLKYQTLVSGFKTDPDPSLLARINDRVIVVKDYTTIMDKNEIAQKELLGVLREAYDGTVVREFGNGIIRIYPDPASGKDRCYFGIVAGVTPKIHIYNKAALGERFLKVDMGRSGLSEKEIIRAAIEGSNNSSTEIENADKRQAAMSALFETIERNDVKEPSAKKYTDQLIALAQFTAVSRTRPERERATGDLLYEACAESASRLGKQFTKLAKSLAVVYGSSTVNDECMRLVRKVAWVTSYGWHRNVYAALWELGDSAPTSQEIAAEVRLSVSSTQRVIADLRDLGICEKNGRRESSKKGGRPADQFRLTKHGKELALKSKLLG